MKYKPKLISKILLSLINETKDKEIVDILVREYKIPTLKIVKDFKAYSNRQINEGNKFNKKTEFLAKSS